MSEFRSVKLMNKLYIICEVCDVIKGKGDGNNVILVLASHRKMSWKKFKRNS